MNPATPFLEVCKTDPDRLAVVEIGGKSISRRVLERRVYSLSGHLRDQGMQKGDRVLERPDLRIRFLELSTQRGDVRTLCSIDRLAHWRRHGHVAVGTNATTKHERYRLARRELLQCELSSELREAQKFQNSPLVTFYTTTYHIALIFSPCRAATLVRQLSDTSVCPRSG